MGYLLTKQADTVKDKTSLGIPYLKPADSETAGNILGGLVAGGGLAGAGAIGDSLFKNKALSDMSYGTAVANDMTEAISKITKSDKPFYKWLNKLMFKPALAGEVLGETTSLGKIIGRGIGYASGFKHLQLPGKLKALGLVAAPLAAGGLIDAAVD